MALLLAGFFGVFLTAIGIAFIQSPQVIAQAFGIDPSHMADLAMTPVAGVRQLAFGLVLIALALRRQRAALGTVLLIGALIPIGDYLLAGQTVGYGAAIRQLITLPVFLILGVALARG
jgi:hypothetical protein